MSTRRSRSRPGTASTRSGAGGRSGAAPRGPSPEDRGQSLALAAFVPAGIAALCSLVVALVVLAGAGGGLAGTAGAATGLWLTLHQVPVYIGDLQLGALPLLPTALLMVGTAYYTRRFVRADDAPMRHLAVIGAAAGGPAVVTVVAVLVIQDAAGSTTLSTVGALPSILIVAAVHAVAAVAGVATRSGRAYLERWGLPDALPAALRAGAAAFGAILAAGAVFVVVGILTGWSRVADGFAAEPSVVGRIGLLVLSVLYLPNLMVGGAAVLAGAPVHIGGAEFSLFGTVPGPVPSVPVLGIVPTEPISSWWAVALVVPAAVAAWCALRTGVRGGTVQERARWAVTSAAVAAAGAVAAGLLAAGPVGIFDPVGPDVPVFGLAVLGWNAAAGLAVVLLGGRVPALLQWRGRQWRLPGRARSGGDGDGAGPADEPDDGPPGENGADGRATSGESAGDLAGDR